MKLLSFEYGGHVFSPVGNFSCDPFGEDSEYFVSTTDKLDINCIWSYEHFYSTFLVNFKDDVSCDIFLCIEDNQLYVPCMEGLKLFEGYHRKSEL